MLQKNLLNFLAFRSDFLMIWTNVQVWILKYSSALFFFILSFLPTSHALFFFFWLLYNFGLKKYLLLSLEEGEEEKNASIRSRSKFPSHAQNFLDLLTLFGYWDKMMAEKPIVVEISWPRLRARPAVHITDCRVVAVKACYGNVARNMYYGGNSYNIISVLGNSRKIFKFRALYTALQGIFL